MFEYLGAVPKYRFNTTVEEALRPVDSKIDIMKRNNAEHLKGCHECTSDLER